MAKPAAISVLAATRAWSMPGFIPMLSNRLAVPARRPSPKNLLHPCASVVRAGRYAN